MRTNPTLQPHPGTGPPSSSDLGADSRQAGAPPTRPLAELENRLGYHFEDPNLLLNALVHKSYLHEVPDFPLGSNERLEFLGDAVLDFIVSSDLYQAHPAVPEGLLTAWRGALVRLSTLAEVAAPLDLGEYLCMSHGEEAAGGRQRPSNMGRAVEALLGAIYLDGGIVAATDVWCRILGDQSSERIRQVLSADYKSQLQQLTQATTRITPSYRLVGSTGPEHAKVFQVQVMLGDHVLASGIGRNKQAAEQDAAEKALAVLSEESSDRLEED
jgi:ribonuclease-3